MKYLRRNLSALAVRAASIVVIAPLASVWAADNPYASGAATDDAFVRIESAQILQQVYRAQSTVVMFSVDGPGRDSETLTATIPASAQALAMGASTLKGVTVELVYEKTRAGAVLHCLAPTQSIKRSESLRLGCDLPKSTD